MAFFGLTALGPQNSFAVAAKSARILQIFEDDDFQQSWEFVNGKEAAHGELKKIGDVMRHLFHGPIPPNDERSIVDAFQNGVFETPDTISFHVFMSIMTQLRNEAEEYEYEFNNKPLKDTCDFNSSSLFLETLRRCGKRGFIRDKQSIPLTANQEFGWEEVKLTRPDKFRKGSDITKFAAELIKNGLY